MRKATRSVSITMSKRSWLKTLFSPKVAMRYLLGALFALIASVLPRKQEERFATWVQRQT